MERKTGDGTTVSKLFKLFTLSHFHHAIALRSPTSNTWVTHLSLLPGTHHIRFVVDDQMRVAEDLPAAVDNEGSLANYVVVGLAPPSETPPSIAKVPVQTPTPAPLPPPPPHQNKLLQSVAATGNGQSFWSSSSNSSAVDPSSHSHRHSLPAQWTSVFPPELLSAAKEEESYLAMSTGRSSVAAPHIPPAPGLPRHLDKLILNVRPGTGASGTNAAIANASRTRDRDERRSGRKGRTMLGMTSSGSISTAGSRRSPSVETRIPVTTASGTNVSSSLPLPPGPSSSSGAGSSGGGGLADDASVLPVPSHVVLHHLSTSAIRNGVLAVGNTTRYREKVCLIFSLIVYPLLIVYLQYLTTIYYKPT